VRFRATPLLVALLACTAKPKGLSATEQEQNPAIEFDEALVPNTPAKVDPPPSPRPRTPVACISLDRPKGSLEFVRQEQTGMPERFDPSGRFAAVCSPMWGWGAGIGAEGSLGEVWVLDHEIYLGRFGWQRDSGDCVTWPGGEDPCAWPKLMEPEFADESISPDGTRLARVLAHAIELRERPSDTLLAELSLEQPKPPGTEVQSVELMWANNMPVALIARTRECLPDEYCPTDPEPEEWIWELRRWANSSAAVEAELVTWESDDDPAPIKKSHVDPLGRWLWVYLDYGPAHDSPWERRQIPLTPEAAAIDADFYEHGIDGAPEPEPSGWLHEDRSLTGSWLTGIRTARVWSITGSGGDGEGNSYQELGWASLQLWPRPIRSGPHQLADDYLAGEQQLTPLGVADEQGVVAWSHCFPDYDIEYLREYGIEDIGDDKCRGNRVVPAGCEARGMSERLDWLLVECGPTWRLLPMGPAAAALEPVDVATADDGPVTAVFGRFSGLALAGERSGLRLLHADGHPRTSYPDVTALLPVTLGPELDRAVGRSQVGLEVFDLGTGERIASIPVDSADDPITHLAFAPDAQRLATSNGQHIQIHDLATAKTTRWDASKVLGLAWRQDGAVLFSGAERALPERAWDPATGKLAPIQPNPKFLERLADADLDPSWRWAFEGDDVILRTLDGLALYLEPDGWFVTETGLYDGTGKAEHLFVRVIGDEQPRVFSLASLPEQLRHPNLLEHFVAGVALPPPRLDITALPNGVAAADTSNESP
jgi:hypothetical protein